MFDSVLVANRGEIARRVIRTARRTGIKAVAVYSDADAALPYRRQAHPASPIGPTQPAPRYLAAAAILPAAPPAAAMGRDPGFASLAAHAGPTPPASAA